MNRNFIELKQRELAELWERERQLKKELAELWAEENEAMFGAKDANGESTPS